MPFASRTGRRAEKCFRRPVENDERKVRNGKETYDPRHRRPHGHDGFRAACHRSGHDAARAGKSQRQISANDYIGKSVYTAADESIGNVTNLIMEQDGGLVAAVIGVGGFLGIGAKDVAVPMDKVTMTRNAQDGTIRLTTTETAETLKAAPEFKTLEQKTSEQNAATPAAPDSTTTSATKP